MLDLIAHTSIMRWVNGIWFCITPIFHVYIPANSHSLFSHYILWQFNFKKESSEASLSVLSMGQNYYTRVGAVLNTSVFLHHLSSCWVVIAQDLNCQEWNFFYALIVSHLYHRFWEAHSKFGRASFSYMQLTKPQDCVRTPCLFHPSFSSGSYCHFHLCILWTGHINV